LQIEVSIELNVSQERAFELVFSDLEGWFKEVEGVVWDHKNSSNGAQSGGQDSTRVCGFVGKQLFETIAYYDAPNAYAYVVDMEKSTASFPVKNPLGCFWCNLPGQTNPASQRRWLRLAVNWYCAARQLKR